MNWMNVLGISSGWQGDGSWGVVTWKCRMMVQTQFTVSSGPCPSVPPDTSLTMSWAMTEGRAAGETSETVKWPGKTAPHTLRLAGLSPQVPQDIWARKHFAKKTFCSLCTFHFLLALRTSFTHGRDWAKVKNLSSGEMWGIWEPYSFHEPLYNGTEGFVLILRWVSEVIDYQKRCQKRDFQLCASSISILVLFWCT